MPRQQQSEITISSLRDFLRLSADTPGDLKEGEAIPTLVVQWSKADELFWTLRLTEFFGDKNNGWGYQPKAKWERDARGNMSYVNSRLYNPVGEFAPPSSAGISGKCSTRVRILRNSLMFEISVTNESPRAWEDCWGWICLIHRWARSFQANCELPVGTSKQPWMPASALPAPMERWLKWCPLKSKQEIATRIGSNQGARWQPHIQAQEGSVRAWRIEGNKQQFVELTSPDAIILGWSHWPCTDMALYFGKVKAGETAKVTGELKFYEKAFVPR